MSNKNIINKIISLIICAVLAVPILSDYKITAEESTQVSQNCIDLIKRNEGFSQYKYWDYTQWTIGYGTYCGEDEYPDGITEPEAEALLRSVIVSYEKILKSFLNKYSITVSQCQYDALVCFTYALGSVWTKYDEFDLKTILINGSENYSFLDIAKAFGEWRLAGGQILQGLVNRRQEETALFLSDRQDNTAEVWRINAKDGVNIYASAGVSYQIIGLIPMNTIYSISDKKISEDGAVWGKVSYNGITGWCILDSSKYIVGGPLDVNQGNNPSPSEIWRITSLDGVKLREGPGLNYSRCGTVPYNAQIIVTAAAEADGYLWGKTNYGGTNGWCALDFAERISSPSLGIPELTGIYIASLPESTVFIEDQQADFKGLTVKGTYSDGTIKDIQDYTISGYQPIVGKWRIDVEYKNQSAQFFVTVREKQLAGIKIDTLPFKTEYKQGEMLDLTGLTVSAIYDNGSSENISEYTVSGYNSTAGVKTLKVCYNEFKAYFIITVNEKLLTGIQLTALPQKLIYEKGDAIDLSGLIVYAFYDNGSKIKISDYASSGYNPNIIGKQQITVSYGGFSSEFYVTVTEKLPEYEKGDVNGDNIKDIFDLIYLNQYIDQIAVFSDLEFKAGDINSDGIINSDDVLLLSKAICGD